MSVREEPVWKNIEETHQVEEQPSGGAGERPSAAVGQPGAVCTAPPSQHRGAGSPPKWVERVG